MRADRGGTRCRGCPAAGAQLAVARAYTNRAPSLGGPPGAAPCRPSAASSTAHSSSARPQAQSDAGLTSQWYG